MAGDPEQAYAEELANRGYITFAPDAIAFEERNWTEDKSGRAEYFELATRLVKGKTLLAKALHDISVGIDYLQSRTEVNPEKIGFIGHSYGGLHLINALKLQYQTVVVLIIKILLIQTLGFKWNFVFPELCNEEMLKIL